MKLRLSSDVNLNEIAVVTSIILIFLAISVSTLLQKNKEHRLQVASNLLSNTILQVRQKAVASKSQYRIEYDYRGNCFRIFRREATGDWVPDSKDNDYYLPPGVFFSKQSTPSKGTLNVDTSGNITATDMPIVIKFRDKNNVRRSIRVSDYGTVQECTHW